MQLFSWILLVISCLYLLPRYFIHCSGKTIECVAVMVNMLNFTSVIFLLGCVLPLTVCCALFNSSKFCRLEKLGVVAVYSGLFL